jgi:hypothetical protein
MGAFAVVANYRALLARGYSAVKIKAYNSPFSEN